MSDQTTLTKCCEQEATSNERRYWRPWHEVTETKEGHVLSVAMPGVPKSGISVSFEDDELTIVGHRETSIPKNWKALVSELGHRDYRLLVRVNIPVDVERINAVVEDGVLRLLLPVKEEAKPRQIAIS